MPNIYLYTQVDEEGQRHLLLDEIVGHRKTSQATQADDGTILRHGRKIPKKTTRGWQICLQFKDGSTAWKALKDVKEANPTELADYAVANKLVSEPAFAWWVPYTLRKRNRIIKATKARFYCPMQKYGITVPQTVKQALALDRANNITFWRDAIRKEMHNVMIAFQVLDDGVAIPPRHTLIDGRLIFDVKMDFTRKARYVVGGHKTSTPKDITYASVVSRESVRIAL